MPVDEIVESHGLLISVFVPIEDEPFVLIDVTREAPAKCSSLLVVLVMGQAKQAARSRAGAMQREIGLMT